MSCWQRLILCSKSRFVRFRSVHLLSAKYVWIEIFSCPHSVSNILYAWVAPHTTKLGFGNLQCNTMIKLWSLEPFVYCCFDLFCCDLFLILVSANSKSVHTGWLRSRRFRSLPLISLVLWLPGEFDRHDLFKKTRLISGETGTELWGKVYSLLVSSFDDYPSFSTTHWRKVSKLWYFVNSWLPGQLQTLHIFF